jgi:hypothetical protein
MAAVVRLLVLVWLVSLPGLTATRAAVWRSDVSLWTDAARGSQKPRPWLNLASALITAQRYPEAAVALDGAGERLARRGPEDVRIGYAYWQALSIDLAIVEGRWTAARWRAIDLTFHTAGQWPPGQARCARLRC